MMLNSKRRGVFLGNLRKVKIYSPNVKTLLSKIGVSVKAGERDVPEAEGICRFPASRSHIDNLTLKQRF